MTASSRAREIFERDLDQIRRRTDRMFVVLLLAQWVFGIGLSIWLTPLAWTGSASGIHIHVKLAVLLGGAMNALPIYLILTRPGWVGTRHVVTVAQMLWSALLIHLTGGRIETHFHVFGSLAFVGLYRDWRVLVTATIVVAGDHLARGMWWPESVYGLANPAWWRFLEHAGWVVFEDLVLIYAIRRGLADLRVMAEREAVLERSKAEIEREVHDRTAELEAAMERYRDLVENTGAIPFELDVETDRITYIAPRAAELLGCTAEDLAEPGWIGRWAHPDDRDALRAAIVFVAGRPGESTTADYRIVGPGGKTSYIRAIFTATTGGRVRAVGMDVTHQRQLELELRQSQKLESLGRLAAGVAHEINTPIQFVSDSVQFVREAAGELVTAAAADPRMAAGGDLAFLAEEIPAALERAQDGLGRVAAIVKSMKQVAYPERRDMTAVDLNAALCSTLTIARSEYRYVADLVLELGELPPVKCHVGDINQAVLNLVVNAAHAVGDVVGDTGQKGAITVRTWCDGDAAVIAVTDTGGGIPDHVRERMFEPFFTTKDVGKGTGQGLAITRAVVVDTHGGTLGCDTVLGAGTTFTLRLPIGGRARTNQPQEIAA